MRILVLGGTSFVGRAIVEDALRAGAEVTVFNRGRTGTGLFPEVERRIGDRDADDYASLGTSEWDAVVDVNGYHPRHVGRAMAALGDRVGRYLFVSSHAVYVRDGLAAGNDEDSPRRPAERSGTEDLTDETYGPLKVACEDDVRARYGDHATIVRPGKVGGPHDNQDTLTYWVRRAARGGRAALPADPAQPVQVVDVRDLAHLVVRLVADDRGGAYNAVGPAEPVTLGGLIHTCAAAAGTEIDLARVPDEAATPMFPLVRPYWPGQQRSAARAHAAGMPATPLARTAADVLAWDRGRGEPPLRIGFTAEQEAAVLARYA
ncbi:MAG TPA: NAD-dependent epimerase/dehydratase family protein [Actinocatenispora sp.]